MQSEPNKATNMTEEVVREHHDSPIPIKYTTVLQISEKDVENSNNQTENETDNDDLDCAVYENTLREKETNVTKEESTVVAVDPQTDNTTEMNDQERPGPGKEASVYVNSPHHVNIEDNIYQNTVVKNKEHVNEDYINIPANVMNAKKEATDKTNNQAQNTVVDIQTDSREKEIPRVQPRPKRHGNLYVRGPLIHGHVKDNVYQNTFVKYGGYANDPQYDEVAKGAVYENATAKDRVYENSQVFAKGGDSKGKTKKANVKEESKTSGATKVYFAGRVFYCRFYHKILLVAILLGLIVIIVLVMMLTMCVKCIE